MSKLQPTRRAALLCLCGAMSAIAATRPAMADEVVHKVGKVTWHPDGYVGKVIALKGYLLVRDKGYVLFSDEASGAVSAHDLPVSGVGYDTMLPDTEYLLHGTFVKGGLTASNGNPYHLELTEAPVEIQP